MYKKMHPLPVEVVLHPRHFEPGQVIEYASELVVKAFSGTYGDYHALARYYDPAKSDPQDGPSRTTIEYRGRPRPIVTFYQGRSFNNPIFNEALGSPDAQGAGEREDVEEVIS